jgi:hypothetical protein
LGRHRSPGDVSPLSIVWTLPARRALSLEERQLVTVLHKRTSNPIGHLIPEDIEQIGVELDAMPQSVFERDHCLTGTMGLPDADPGSLAKETG